MQKILRILGVLGVFLGIAIVFLFLYLEFFSGKQVYKSPLVNILNEDYLKTSLELEPSGNTYRVILHTKYNKQSIDCLSDCVVFTYHAKVFLDGEIIKKSDGRVKYDDDDDDGSNSLNSRLKLFDFTVDKVDNYQIIIELTPESENISGADVFSSFQIRSNVKSLDIKYAMLGFFIGMFSSLSLFFTGKRDLSEKKEYISSIEKLKVDEKSDFIINAEMIFSWVIVSIFAFLFVFGACLGFFVYVILIMFGVPNYLSLGVSVTLIILAISLFLVSTWINIKNTYFKFYPNYLEVHEHKGGIFKANIIHLRKKYSDIKHFEHVHKKRIDLKFLDGYSIQITNKKLDINKILKYIRKGNHQFSILDEKGLSFNKKFEHEYLFALTSGKYNKMIAKRDVVGKWTLSMVSPIDKKEIAYIKYPYQFKIINEYKVKTLADDSKILLGQYNRIVSKRYTLLPNLIKSFRIFNSENMMIAHAFIEDSNFVSNSYTLQIGSREIQADLNGLINQNGQINSEYFTAPIEMNYKALKGVLTLSSENALPAKFSIIMMLVIIADLHYEQDDKD